MTTPRCPTCKQKLIPIAYGLPGAGLTVAAEKGRVILGGCMVSEYDPELACEQCRRYLDRDGDVYTGEVDPVDFRRTPPG